MLPAIELLTGATLSWRADAPRVVVIVMDGKPAEYRNTDFGDGEGAPLRLCARVCVYLTLCAWCCPFSDGIDTYKTKEFQQAKQALLDSATVIAIGVH